MTLTEVTQRIAELEQRVERLEKGGEYTYPYPKPAKGAKGDEPVLSYASAFFPPKRVGRARE
jgi:hypothetical protein